jgi:SAM (Sterile alpha motif) domain-containing protein/adenylate/guanylate cyclase family protein
MVGQINIAAWLEGLGLDQYESAFRDNAIDADILPDLGDSDLEKLGVAILGHRKKFLKAIAALSERDSEAGPAVALRRPRLEPVSVSTAERRPLTVMFVDLVGSSGLAERLDPEDLRAAIRAYQDSCAGVVARFGGFVAKYLGDGVLAYFGWPRIREDEVQRAVAAGLAVVKAVAGLAVPGGPLAARVGIASGLVIVGDLLGEGPRVRRPSLARRLISPPACSSSQNPARSSSRTVLGACSVVCSTLRTSVSGRCAVSFRRCGPGG